MASSIPGAINYWLNLAETTLKETNTAPNGVQVWFGAQLLRYTAPITLQVVGVVDITHEWAELGSQYKIEETYRIRNQLVSYTGGTPSANNPAQIFQDRMTDVFSNLQLLTVALGNDYDLGGNVRLCLPMVEGELQPGSDPGGKIMCSLMFDIHCEARITSLT